LGQELVDLHLLKNIPDDKSVTVSFVSLDDIPDGFTADKITVTGNSIPLSVSQADRTSRGGAITSVEVFDFEISSRKPIDLWIKNRIKDKVRLGLEDLRHIKKMIIAVKRTIVVTRKIEQFGEEYLKDI
jgi:hypothetical protein